MLRTGYSPLSVPRLIQQKNIVDASTAFNPASVSFWGLYLDVLYSFRVSGIYWLQFTFLFAGIAPFSSTCVRQAYAVREIRFRCHTGSYQPIVCVTNYIIS